MLSFGGRHFLPKCLSLVSQGVKLVTGEVNAGDNFAMD